MNRFIVFLAAVCAGSLFVYAYYHIIPPHVPVAEPAPAAPFSDCVSFNGPFSDTKTSSPNARCFTKETDGYLVYVPSNISAEDRVPLIVALSPSADALSMISAFRLTADNLSVVIVASKVSRNYVNFSLLLPGYEEMMNDSAADLPVDGNKIIFAGMSGGGQASYGAANSIPSAFAPSSRIAAPCGPSPKCHRLRWRFSSRARPTSIMKR